MVRVDRAHGGHLRFDTPHITYNGVVVVDVTHHRNIRLGIFV